MICFFFLFLKFSHRNKASTYESFYVFTFNFFWFFLFFFFGYAGSLSLKDPEPHLVATSRAILHCSLFKDLWWLLLLRSTALGIRASVVVAHRLSCSSACGIYLDLDRPLH